MLATTMPRSLIHLADHVLLHDLKALLVRDRATTAELLAHLAEAADQWQAFLQKMPPQWQRGVIMLRDGYSHREVAELLGVSERTLARHLAHVRRYNFRPA